MTYVVDATGHGGCARVAAAHERGPGRRRLRGRGRLRRRMSRSSPPSAPGWRPAPQTLSQLLDVLGRAGVPVLATNQQHSNVALTVAVPGQDAERAVRALHDAFIRPQPASARGRRPRRRNARREPARRLTESASPSHERSRRPDGRGELGTCRRRHSSLDRLESRLRSQARIGRTDSGRGPRGDGQRRAALRAAPGGPSLVPPGGGGRLRPLGRASATARRPIGGSSAVMPEDAPRSASSRTTTPRSTARSSSRPCRARSPARSSSGWRSEGRALFSNTSHPPHGRRTCRC